MVRLVNFGRGLMGTIKLGSSFTTKAISWNWTTQQCGYFSSTVIVLLGMFGGFALKG
jgi:hypothetical protein